MNKLYKIFIVSLLLSNNTFCQQIYPIKESYDQIIEPYYSNNNYNNPASNWWQAWGPILQSYLRMYETTGDKAYLNELPY